MIESAQARGQYYIDTIYDKNKWNSFVKQNDGPVYAHWGWNKAVASYSHDVWPLVAREQDSGTIRGVLPLSHVDSRLFGSQLLSPAFAERGSVVLDDLGETAEVKRLLLDQTVRLAEQLNVDVASLRGSVVGPTEDFTVRNQYVTFRVPVRLGSDAVWSEIKDSRQRQITQAAENSSLRFKVGRSLDDLREYYRLYLRTMRGHGSPPHSFEFFKLLWDHLHEAGNLRLSMVVHDGSLINGMIDLSLGSTVYQWGIVSDYERRDLNGGSWLLWKSLQWAAEQGYDTYEFGRTREGSGVYMFKRSFGGSKVWYDDLHYFPDRPTTLPDPEDNQYQLARRVWKRLPIPVTRRLGPHIRKRIGI